MENCNNNPYNLEKYDESSEKNELTPIQQELYNEKMEQLKQDSQSAQEKYSLQNFDENSLEQQIDNVQSEACNQENPHWLENWNEIKKEENNSSKNFFSQVKRFFNFS